MAHAKCVSWPASAGSAGAALGASSGTLRRRSDGQCAASSCSARPLMKAPRSRGSNSCGGEPPKMPPPPLPLPPLLLLEALPLR